MAKRRPDSGGDIPEWVVTYGDLMSLLLCFFILLAAFSELKQEREFRKVLESIQEAMGFRGGMGVADLDSASNNSMTNFQQEQARMNGDEMNTSDNVDNNVIGRQEKVSIVHEGSMQAVGGSISFEESSFELTRSAEDLIRTSIVPKIKGQRFVVRVVGHAWGEREKLSGYDFNELGYRRAKAVADYMVRECGVDELILRVESAGAQEPRSISPGQVEPPPGNRRVQVWVTGRTVEQAHPDPFYTGTGGG